MSNQTVPTVLANYPTRPTKAELLDSLEKVLADVCKVHDFINEGDENGVLDEATGTLLALTCTRLNTLKAVLGTIAYLETKARLIVGTT